MSAKAYVLIETEAGKASTVVERLRLLPGVSEADAVTGPHDIIAVLTGREANDLARLVLVEIQGLDGVKGTLTCLVVST
jgi:DNA-binding Lrp family transcriptional regulator